MISNEDLNMLEKYLDDRYVLKANCGESRENMNKKLANDDKRIELLIHDFKAIKWLVATVAAASIGTLVASLFELILK